MLAILATTFLALHVRHMSVALVAEQHVLPVCNKRPWSVTITVPVVTLATAWDWRMTNTLTNVRLALTADVHTVQWMRPSAQSV